MKYRRVPFYSYSCWLIVGWSLLMGLIGCRQPLSNTTQEVNAVTKMSTATIPPMSSPINSALGKDLEITTIATMEPAIPTASPENEIRKLCPDNRQVEIEELFQDESQLMLVQVSYESANVYDIILRERKFQVPGLDFYTRLSKDKNYLAYLMTTKTGSKEVWISDIDGENARKITDNLPESFSHFSWTDNGEIAFWHYIERDLDDEIVVQPIEILDPFTGKVRKLLKIEQSIYKNIVFLKPDAEEAVFIRDNGLRNWMVHDYQTGIAREIFPLRGSIRFDWAPDGEKFAILKGDLKIIDANTLQELTTINLTPLEAGVYGTDFFSWSSNDQFAFELYYWSEEQENFPKQGLYVFDLPSQSLTYYCLTDLGAGRKQWSKDGQFLAWSTWDTEDPEEIIILEVDTGRFAIVEGFHLIDW